MDDKALNVVIEKLSEICNRQVVHRPNGRNNMGSSTRCDAEPESAPHSSQKVLSGVDTTGQVFYCSDCGYSSHNKYYLKQHMDLVHNSKRPFKCPFCDYAGKRSYALKEHLIVHSSDRPHQCVHCHATFRKKGHLTNHIKMHQSHLICSLCKVTCKGKQALLTHLEQQHADGNDQLYACDQCLFASSDNEEMARHIKEHNDSKKLILLKCSECGFTCTTNAVMRDHMIAVHLKDVVKATSTVMDYQNAGVESFVEVTDQETESMFSCGVCGFNADDEQRMSEHMASHVVKKSSSKSITVENIEQNGKFTYNPTSRTFACSICSYTCDQQRTIKSHVWKHSGHKDILYPMFQKGEVVKEDDDITNKCVDEPNTFQFSNRKGVVSVALSEDLENGNSQPVTEIVLESSEHHDDEFEEDILIEVEDNPGMDIANQAAVIAKIVSTKNEVLPSTLSAVDGLRTNGKRRASGSTDSDAKRLKTGESVDIESSEKLSTTNTLNKSVDQASKYEKILVITNTLDSKSSVEKKSQLENSSTDKQLEKDDKDDSESKEKENSAAVSENGDASSDVDSSKRSGICSSLLAVIEQLRERSGSEDVPDGRVLEVREESTKHKSAVALNRQKLDSENWDSSNVEKLDDGNFRCKLCHYQSVQFHLIRMHMRMHKIKQPFECSLCDVVTENSAKLQDHMLLHCKVRTYQCKNCPATFPYKSQLRAHQRAHTEEPFVCEKCLYETTNPLAFRDHIRVHMNAGDEESSVLPLSKENLNPSPVPREDNQEIDLKQAEDIEKSLKSSQKIVTSESDVNKKGNDVIDGQNSVLFRMMQVGKSSSPLFICDQCEFQSDDLEVLKEHFVTRHARTSITSESSKPVQESSEKPSAVLFKSTSIKNVVSASTAGLDETLPLSSNLHGNKKSSQDIDPASGTSYQTNNSEKIVDIVDNLKCNLCEFVAISVRSLKSHMKRHINDQRFVEQPLEQYKCAMCGYVCHHLPSLKSHMWRHASEDKYSYHRANDVINAAIDRVSMTSDPVEDKRDSSGDTFITFRCCQCGFESTDQSTLTEHMRNHLDVIAKTLEV